MHKRWVFVALVVGLALTGCSAGDSDVAPPQAGSSPSPTPSTVAPTPTQQTDATELGRACATVATMIARITAAHSAAVAAPETWPAAVADAQSLASALPDRPDLEVFRAEVLTLPPTVPAVNAFGAGVVDASSGPSFVDACAAEGAPVG